MKVSSGTKNNSSPKEPSCTTVTGSFNGVLLVVTAPQGAHLLQSCGRPGLSGMKLCLMVFYYWYDDTTDCSLGKLALGAGFVLLRTFGLLRWGLGGSSHVEVTAEKLSFASQAAR
ncbi:hypothetical protein TNCV_2732901 [Trichonephila clavipes]|nr:hypothetical protein TNCV_2732901 [Trichonephila clavipes]